MDRVGRDAADMDVSRPASTVAAIFQECVFPKRRFHLSRDHLTVLMSSIIVRVYSATAAPLSSPRPSTTQEDHRRLCRPFSLATAPKTGPPIHCS
jgi:hypothetical protein